MAGTSDASPIQAFDDVGRQERALFSCTFGSTIFVSSFRKIDQPHWPVRPSPGVFQLSFLHETMMSTPTKRSAESNKKRKHGSNADVDVDVTSQTKVSALEEENTALRAELQAKQRRIDELTNGSSAGKSPHHAQRKHVLIPRVAEDTDVSTLKREAWERGHAVPAGAGEEEHLTSVHGRPPAQHVLPRITEDMDVSDLQREAWERGWAAPDDATGADLLARIRIGSISLAGVKKLMDMEEKASNKALPIEHAAADIFVEHGLQFVALEERFLSLAFVSKNLHMHCVNRLGSDFRPLLPALVASIARSSCSRGKRFTFGRVVRYTMHSPHMPVGFLCPSLNLSHLEEIDVLIQIDGVSKMPGTGEAGGKALGYALGRLQYDPATRDLYSNAECDHFDFQIPLYQTGEGQDSVDASDHLKCLNAAFAQKRCLSCANCTSPIRQSQPCLRPSSILGARIVFRHRMSGTMAHVLLDAQPLVSGGIGDVPVGSYNVLFQTTLDLPAFGKVSADLQFRVFSKERKDTNSFAVSTRPFPNSPENDPQISGLPSYCQMERSNKCSRLAFSMWTQEREDEESSSGDEVDDLPPTKCLLQALRNYCWG